MSFMTENKARRILKDYMDAELQGDDSKAASLEEKLNNAGWKISVGAEGYTVIRENGGLFNTDNIDNTFNKGNTSYPNPPYSPQITKKYEKSNTPLIIGISIGVLILIIALILGVRAYNQRQHVVSG